MTENENWAQAENVDVELAKDSFAEAVQAQALRQQLTGHAAGFISRSSADGHAWANAQLARLGATPITGRAEYRMNQPITGVFGWRCTATSRAEALARFNEQVARVAEAGKITADGSYDNVYGVKFTGEPVFYSGPEDPDVSTAEDLDLDGLKTAIREMFKQGAILHGWNVGYADRALSAMGLDTLPPSAIKTVEVPVSGVVQMPVRVFEGDHDNAVQYAAAATIARAGNVSVKPDEVGVAAVVDAKDDDEDEDGGPF